jgi:hypothetical protein
MVKPELDASKMLETEIFQTCSELDTEAPQNALQKQ